MTPGLTLEVQPGGNISATCKEAQHIADTLNRAVGFKFNSVRCVAVPGGDAVKLAERQQRAQHSVLVVHSDSVGSEIAIEDED